MLIQNKTEKNTSTIRRKRNNKNTEMQQKQQMNRKRVSLFYIRYLNVSRFFAKRKIYQHQKWTKDKLILSKSSGLSIVTLKYTNINVPYIS